jgi:hypothetical protein
MFYIKDAYAKLWSIDNEGKYPKGRITTSDKRTDENDKVTYINSNWFVTFFGDSKKKAMKLNGDEKIKILKGKISNTGTKQDDGSYKNYLNVVVFDFELVESNNGETKSKRKEEPEESVEESEELPF